MRTIDADELIRILEEMERDAEARPEVGLKPAPMLRKIRHIVDEMAGNTAGTKPVRR